MIRLLLTLPLEYVDTQEINMSLWGSPGDPIPQYNGACLGYRLYATKIGGGPFVEQSEFLGKNLLDVGACDTTLSHKGQIQDDWFCCCAPRAHMTGLLTKAQKLSFCIYLPKAFLCRKMPQKAGIHGVK
ncbi:hypothetical protein AX15_007567 [Amanita polypyramis BW_CC]|nr:hypothetical protein AX15_007567 [Amanita polypyramis BW_CC]